jgi:ERCC4-type nuclease
MADERSTVPGASALSQDDFLTDMATCSKTPDLAVFPAYILIDTREQAPYTFAGLRTDAADGRRPLHVVTQAATLPSGDYSIEGHRDGPNAIAVERKSLADLYGTLGQGRRRFVAELERLATYAAAHVVMEASWEQILTAPPRFSALNPKTIHRSVIAWTHRYPTVHWWPMGGRTPAESRRLAEITTFRILERFWKEQQAKRAR